MFDHCLRFTLQANVKCSMTKGYLDFLYWHVKPWTQMVTNERISAFYKKSGCAVIIKQIRKPAAALWISYVCCSADFVRRVKRYTVSVT